jgi:CHASE3 domain sensor protein
MHTRAARLVLLAIFIASLAVAAFLFRKSESLAAAQLTTARTFEASARMVEHGLVELRATQRGYVAAGQTGDFWIPRVAQSVGSLQQTVASLRATAISPVAQASLDEVTSALGDFARVDKRAIEYIRRAQPLLASDVIFGEGRELTDSALAALEQARGVESGARLAAADTEARRGVFALIAAAASSLLAVLLLVPQPAPARTAADADRSAGVRAAQPLRDESATPAVAASSQEPQANTVTAEAGAEPGTGTAEVLLPALGPAGFAPAMVTTDFGGVASLCVDLARVVDTRALPSLLERARTILDASGIILWIADPDGRELNPIFAQGYPPQLINRLGTIPRDAENATAAAFRTSLLQTVMADAISAGAIAAPLVTPGGCVGVMAAEVMHDAERQDMKLAAATIVAAQLATLVGPPAKAQARSGAAGA